MTLKAPLNKVARLFSIFFVVFITSIEISNAQYIGIGTFAPKAKLHVVNSSSGNMGVAYETIVSEDSLDTKLGVYNTSAAPLNYKGSALTLGYSKYLNPLGYYPGFEMQYGVWSSSGYVLRFNALARNLNGSYNIANTYSNVMVLSHNGMVGINLTNGLAIAPVAPTANLDVYGSVRFQSLPSGTGKNLVIDGNGNLKVSSTTSLRQGDTEGDVIVKLQEEIQLLKEQIASIQAQLSAKNSIKN